MAGFLKRKPSIMFEVISDGLLIIGKAWILSMIA